MNFGINMLPSYSRVNPVISGGSLVEKNDAGTRLRHSKRNVR
jgi:hypothetical protein